MVTITSRAALRSIANEAGRQGDFYQRRSIPDLVTVWSEIEAEAYAALVDGSDLLIGKSQKKNSPIPIKAGE